MKSAGKIMAHIIGAGEGCDYTIGCNHVLLELKALNQKDAVKEVSEMFDHNIDTAEVFGLEQVQSVVLYHTFEMVDLDISTIKNIVEANATKEQREAKEQFKADTAEYERLREKLGK